MTLIREIQGICSGRLLSCLAISFDQRLSVEISGELEFQSAFIHGKPGQVRVNPR